MSWIIFAVVAVVILGSVSIYNSLVQGRIRVKEAWSGIDVQLKRRHDLIPNLVETVKGYAKHEKNVLEEVTRLRTQVSAGGDVKQTAAVENNITQGLRNLFAVAENYPDLKASQSFSELQKKLSEIEDEVQLARRYYNGTVRDYNINVQVFPANIVANMFQFKAEDFFEIQTVNERNVPEVKLS